MYKRGIYCRKVSVCLSRSKTAKPIVEILPTSASPNILAFVEDSIVAKFWRNPSPPTRALHTRKFNLSWYIHLVGLRCYILKLRCSLNKLRATLGEASRGFVSDSWASLLFVYSRTWSTQIVERFSCVENKPFLTEFLWPVLCRCRYISKATDVYRLNGLMPMNSYICLYSAFTSMEK